MLKGKNNTISATKGNNTLTMLIKQSFQTHINPYNMQETDYIKTVTYKEWGQRLRGLKEKTVLQEARASSIKSVFLLMSWETCSLYETYG